MSNLFNEPPSNYNTQNSEITTLTSDPTGNKLGSWAWLHTPAASFSEKPEKEKLKLVREMRSLRKSSILHLAEDLDQANDNQQLSTTLWGVLRNKSAMAVMAIAVFVGGIAFVVTAEKTSLKTVVTPLIHNTTGQVQDAQMTYQEFNAMSDDERLEAMFEDPDRMAAMLNDISVGE